MRRLDEAKGALSIVVKRAGRGLKRTVGDIREWRVKGAKETGRNTPLVKWATISLGIMCFIAIVILPLTSIFKFAFDDGIEGFFRAVTTEEARNALYNSIVFASLTTIVNLFVGTTLAFAMTRYRFPGVSILKALVDLPLAIPASVVGLSLLLFYGPRGFGPFFEERGLEVIGALPGVLLAHVFVTFPFMIRSVSVVLEKFDYNLEDAATTLGANRVQTFFKVMVPMIRGGIVAGSGLTFTRSLGEFGATLIILGVGLTQLTTGPLYMYYKTQSDIDYQSATSVAIVLMIVPFIFLLTMNYIVARMEARS